MSENRIDVAELTRRLGASDHEQSAVLAWTGVGADHPGWTEDEVAELIDIWRADGERIANERA